MSVRKAIQAEMKRSNGKVQVMKIDSKRLPSKKGLLKLDRQISAQISANEAMRNRSMARISKASII